MLAASLYNSSPGTRYFTTRFLTRTISSETNWYALMTSKSPIDSTSPLVDTVWRKSSEEMKLSSADSADDASRLNSIPCTDSPSSIGKAIRTTIGTARGSAEVSTSGESEPKRLEPVCCIKSTMLHHWIRSNNATPACICSYSRLKLCV